MLAAVKLIDAPEAFSETWSRVARGLLYATALVPIVLVPGFFFPYVTTRAVYFRVLVEAVTAILLYLVLRREVKLAFRKDVVFWALSAWVGANALSALFGVAPMRSLFGDHERMGGVWFWAHLLAFYVALRTFLREEHWRVLLRALLAVAVFIAGYGILQQLFHPFRFGVGDLSAGVTIGNNGLLAAYLLANVAIAGVLAADASWRIRLVYAAIGALLLIAMVFSGNRSSTLAFVIGTGAAVVAYAIWTKSLRGWRVVAVVALFGLAIALPFVSRASWARPATSQIPALNRLSGGVDSSRVIQWRAAVEGIRSRPLLGVGPENYEIVWSRFYHPEMYRFIGDSRWDRAHNAYLDAFATVGVLGFLSLLAVFLTLGWSSKVAAHSRTKRDQARSTPPLEEAIAFGFFIAYAFYLFFWFFDIHAAIPWVALAAYVSGRAAGLPLIEFTVARERRWQTSVVLAVGGVVFVAMLYVHGLETLRMARTLHGIRVPGKSPNEVLRGFESVFDSPAPVTQHAFLMYAGHLASLRPNFDDIRKDAASSAHFDRAFIRAIEEFERQASRDPFNERLAVQHARVLMLGAYYYGNMRLYESALRRLQRAVDLAPRRVPTRLALGMAYLNVQRPREAIAEFQKAYALYPPLAQTQAYLGLAYGSLGEHRTAMRWLTSAIESGYSLDPAILGRVSREAAESGESALAGELVQRYLTKKYGPAFMWGLRANAGNATDYALAKAAAEYLARAGYSARAGVLGKAADELCGRPASSGTFGTPAFHRTAADLTACREPWRARPAD